MHKNERSDIKALLRFKQKSMCCYCGVKMRVWGKRTPPGGLPDDAETLEHLRRFADGGTNVRDNLALSCHQCNLGRGNLDWLTYASLKRGEMSMSEAR